VEFSRFDPSLFEFLEELADNNNRPWFEENRWRYEQEVLAPSLAFLRAFRPRLKKISKYFLAQDRRVGGSLMRIYRDTRFSKDKSPYKTNVGIQFRHELGRDIHAPGLYVHLAPDECFLGVGLWHPDRPSLGQIRQAIVEQTDRWKRARNAPSFQEYFELAGECLKRPPRGVPIDHPWVEDLKRIDFVGMCPLSEADVLDEAFLDHVAAAFGASRPLMRFLCRALQMPF
jgi:uncharacterized protein (TIGR02453 family)